MKLIFTISLLAFMAQLSPRIEARHPDLSGHFRHSEEFLNKSPDGSNRRFHRNAKDDNLTTSLNHLKMIARVTNGIYLQTGLTSGTIPADKLISELLRFGSVTSTQIAAIDSSKIQTAVATLKGLPSNPKSTSFVDNVEISLDVFKQLLEEINGLGDMTKQKGKKEFTDLLDGLSKNKVILQPVEDLFKTKLKWTIELVTYTDPIAPDNIKKNMEDVVTALNKVKSSGSKLTQMLPIWKPTTFTSAMDGMSNGLKNLRAAELVIKQSSVLTRKSNEWSGYSDFIGSFFKTIASLKSVYSDVLAIKGVIDGYQLESRKRSLEYTTGFSDGPHDIALISVDLNDQWMKDVVKSDRLSVALSGLKSLEVLAKKVEDVLKEPSLGPNLVPLMKIFDSVNQLASEEGGIKTGITAAQNCKLPQLQSISQTDTKALETSLQNIDLKFSNYTQLVGLLIDAVTASGLAETCDEFIAISNAGDTAKNVEAFRGHAKFKKLKKDINDIYILVEKIKNVEDPTTIQTEAAEALKHLTVLDTLHTSVANYAGYLNCLQNNKGLKLLIAAHEKVKAIRTVDPTTSSSLNSGLEVMKKVAGTSEDLKKLKKSIDGMKGVTNPEIDGLKELKEPGKHSKTIGSAVQGVSNMKNALEKKTDLDALVGGLDVVRKHQSQMNKKELDALMSLKPTFDAMYKSLTSFESSVTAPKTTTTLADQSEIFVKAKGVTGVSVDLQKIADSVKMLKEKVDNLQDKTKLESLETSIRMADLMGLEFSGYSKSFDGSKATLGALDSFFAGYAQKMLKVTSAMKEKKEEKPMNLTFLIIAAGILLVTLGSIVLINFLWYKLFFYSYSSTFPCFFPQPNYWKPSLKFFSLAVHRLTTTVNSDYKLYKYVETSEGERPDAVVEDLVRKCDNLRTYFTKLYKQDTKRANDTVDTKDFGLVEERPISYSDEKVLLTARDVDPPEGAKKAPADKTKTPPEVDAKSKTPADGKVATATDEKKDNRKTGGADAKTSQSTSQATSKTEATSKNSEVKSTISKVQKDKTVTKGKPSQKPTSKAQPPKPEAPTEKPIDYKDCRAIQKYIKSTRPILTGYGNRFNNDFIAASHFKLPYRKDWYLCESPQTESKRTHSTIGKFWWMVKQKKARMIVMFAETELAKKDCSKYFPLEEGVEESFGGDLKVKCLKIGKDKHGVEYRKLSARFGSGKRFTVTHYWFPSWMRQLRTLERQQDIVKILKTALSHRYPVVVHCPTGSVETAMFALAGHMICNIYKKKTMDFQTSLIALRSSRYYALSDAEDYACVGILIMEFFAEGIDIEKIGDEELKKRYLEVQKFWMKWPVTLNRPERYNYVAKYADREASPLEFHSGSDSDEN